MAAINHIAVLGSGTMGQGIAQLCAMHGYNVMLYDVKPDITRKAYTSIQKSLEILQEKGKVSDEQKDAALRRIQPQNDFRQLQVDLAIEAVVERLDVKQMLFQELEKINNHRCVLVTNTSSIPVTKIASSLKHPERFAGLHFFNPAAVMKLVEIVRGEATNDHTINLLQEFASAIGKQFVHTQDSPGFIVNRVARHFYVEALKLLEEGVASHDTIDKLLKGAGFKMGPFELIDLIGMDTNLAVTKSIYEAFYHDAKFRPSRIQEQKVEAGHLGRKSGKGFYDYTK